jgi:hypothetical protein
MYCFPVGVQQPDEQLSVFARLCRKAPVEHDLGDDYTLPDLSTDVIHVFGVQDDGGITNLEAHVLPFPWMSFSVSKQDHALNPRVCFNRMGQAHIGRHNETIRLLRAGKNKVGWIGSPGIGKSSGMNLILVDMLRNIGNEGWRDQVVYRVGKQILQWSWNEEKKSVDATKIVYDQASDAFGALETISERLSTSNGVLLLEMQESETDPTLFGAVLIPVSARDAINTLKTMHKSGGLTWILDDPYSRAELIAAALFHYSCGETMFGASEQEVATLVSARFEEVGGFPRHILCTGEHYTAYVVEQNGVALGDLFDNLTATTVWNLPTAAKFFFGPFICEKVTIPSLSENVFEFRFFSHTRAVAAYKQCEGKVDRIVQLHNFGLKWQVEEAMMESALLGEQKLQDTCKLAQWEWFQDPGKGRKIKNKLESAPLGVECATSNVKFAGRYFKYEVNSLKEKVLYSSTGWQTVLCECIMVSHTHKRVFAFQSSSMKPNQHVFKIQQIKNIREHLRMPVTYKLVIVYVLNSDGHTLNMKGMECEHPHGETTGISAQRGGLRDMVEGYIVRAHISVGEHVLSTLKRKKTDDTASKNN